MPTPTWLSRLELDLVNSRTKRRRKLKRTKPTTTTVVPPGPVPAPPVTIQQQDKEKEKEKEEDTKTTTSNTLLVPTSSITADIKDNELYQPVQDSPSIPSDFAPSPASKKKRPPHPKLATLLKKELPKEKSFQRKHLQSARLGELLLPVRTARKESAGHSLFGPHSPINRTLRKTFSMNGGDLKLKKNGEKKEDTQKRRPATASEYSRADKEQVLKENPLPLSRDIILSPKKWSMATSEGIAQVSQSRTFFFLLFFNFLIFL